MNREARIARERAELGLRPWQFAPSEINDGVNPYAASPGSAGFAAWRVAQQWRDEIRQRDPDYFSDA